MDKATYKQDEIINECKRYKQSSFQRSDYERDKRLSTNALISYRIYMRKVIELNRYNKSCSHYIRCNICDRVIVNHLYNSQVPENIYSNKQVKKHISTNSHIHMLIRIRRALFIMYDLYYTRLGPHNYDELKTVIEEIKQDLETIENLIPTDWKGKPQYLDNDYVIDPYYGSDNDSDSDSDDD